MNKNKEKNEKKFNEKPLNAAEKANEALVDEQDEKMNFEALTKEEAVQMLSEYYELINSLNKKTVELEEKLAAAEKESLSNKDSWYRTAAEFENFKKRNAETRQTAYFDGKKDAITLLLVIGDSVDRALSVELDEKTKAGVTLIKKQFSESLAAIGVEEIDPIGKPFDPTVAEAIATVAASDGEQANTVKTVYKKGYKLSGKMLRYAQVIVTQ